MRSKEKYTQRKQPHTNEEKVHRNTLATQLTCVRPREPELVDQHQKYTTLFFALADNFRARFVGITHGAYVIVRQSKRHVVGSRIDVRIDFACVSSRERHDEVSTQA